MSETATNDNSHIVGHINEDGSIEPGECERYSKIIPALALQNRSESFHFSVAAAASSSSSSTAEAAGAVSTSTPANAVVAVPLEELTYDTQVSDMAVVL